MQTSLLEEFIDEEVVDKSGKPIGVLDCYWESSSSGELFLGIRLGGQEDVHVVPGIRVELVERHSLVQIGFDAKSVRSAPLYDCDKELWPRLEQQAMEHFGLYQ